MNYANLKEKAYELIIGPPRLNRKKYIIRTLIFSFVVPVIGVLFWYLLNYIFQPIPILVYILGAPIALAAFVTLVIANLSNNISRLHDIDKSGWWCLIMLFGWLKYIFLIILCLVPGTGKPNKYGEAS